MGIIGRNQCKWSTHSDKDPRFNMSGESHGLFSSIHEIEKAILEKVKELGVFAPDDLEYESWKD